MLHNVTPEPEKRLTSKQRRAALLLAEGTTVVDAANKVGVARETVERWKRQPLFLEEIRQSEDKIYDESLRSLKRKAQDAIDCLTRNMDGKKVSPYVQVAAAGKVLDLGLDVHKISEVLVGLSELQRRLDDADQR